jgi:hypothetical protein
MKELVRLAVDVAMLQGQADEGRIVHYDAVTSFDVTEGLIVASEHRHPSYGGSCQEDIGRVTSNTPYVSQTIGNPASSRERRILT